MKFFGKIWCFFFGHDLNFVEDEIGDIYCPRCGADLTN